MLERLASIRSRIGENMDRYLFKAKRVDNGEWVQGNLIQSCDATDGWEAIIIPTKNSNMFTKHIKRGYGNLGFENWYRVDPSTICQCTGLKDKNGKLIWENDIVNTQCGKAIVVWDKAELRIKWIKDTIWRKDLHFWTNEDDWKCEVIGNIFDNPELLESEE
jgi:uncharacterized phage protein (TIGR01671 family)